jgi:hypothetical protein
MSGTLPLHLAGPGGVAKPIPQNRGISCCLECATSNADGNGRNLPRTQRPVSRLDRLPFGIDLQASLTHPGVSSLSPMLAPLSKEHGGQSRERLMILELDQPLKATNEQQKAAFEGGLSI